MRFPLTDKDRAEIERFALRSSCQHCFFYRGDARGCAHEWPSEEQAAWPLDEASHIALCKEFELL